MEIVYIITVVWLFISTMLIKKSEEKQNVLLRTILSIILLTAYNTFLSFAFFVINIKYTLLSLTIANTIVSIILTGIIYEKRNFQKYFIKIKDLIFVVVLLILVIGIGIKQYGFPFQIKYETTDPAVHFLATKDFYESKKLDWGGMMPAAFVNTEILFDIFDIIISEESFYYLYIIFDLIILFLTASIFYLGITNKNTVGKTKNLIAMIFTILFILGYPLNSMIFGYAYLSVGILYMTTLIAVSEYIKNKEFNFIALSIEMFLLVFGIFFSYYFFVPVVYSAFGLYILFNMLKNRKNKNILSIITKENVIKVVIILVLPTILGFCYFVLPGLIQSGETNLGHIVTEGYIYRDLYSNFILLAPLTIYYIIYNIKNKRNSLSTIMFLISALFTLYLLRQGLRGEASSYYYYKMYFLLWILAIYMNIKSMYIMIENKDSIYAYSFLTVLVAIFLISYTGYDYKISSINILFNPTNSINSFANIYEFNKNKLNLKQYIYSQTQIDAIKYIINKADNKSQILINGDALKMLWANSVWEITDTRDVVELQKEKELDINKWLENTEKKYLIYFDTSKDIEKETEKYKTIYEAEGVRILEKIDER